MQTKTNSALSRPLVVMLLASLCCLLWGSAIPFINLGYRYFEIGGSDTATQILFGGCRFLMAGMLTILFESIAQKKIALPKRTSWGNVVKLFADSVLYVCGKSTLFCKIWFALTRNDAFAK